VGAAAEQLLVSDAIPEPRKVRYVLAATSGARDGELAGLRFDDVDLDAATFSITKSTTTKGGTTMPDGTKCRGVAVREPKTDASVRTLPLHVLAVRTLRAWKAQGWARWVGRAPHATDLVFPSAEGKPWRPASARHLRDDLAAAQLPTLYLDKHPVRLSRVPSKLLHLASERGGRSRDRGNTDGALGSDRR
jgi:integrase